MKCVQLLDGMKVAYQEWGNQNLRKVIALHGWLDNSNTFKYLGPYLADRGFHVVAVDCIGHGKSGHLGTGAFYTMPKHVSVVREVVENMGWSKNYMLGHSMVKINLLDFVRGITCLLSLGSRHSNNVHSSFQ
jgi:pimeloyl-ACP methyl ester carboxylesterase